MGTWGTALYSDDLAADIRSDFRDFIGQGLSEDEAVEKLSLEYASSLGDPDSAPVFWLAVADTAWGLGRPQARATAEALHVIEAGTDLRRWDSAKDRRKREVVLLQLSAKLRSAPPPPRPVGKRFVARNDWHVGEVIAYRLTSGSWTLFRVTGHHQDKGGRYAVCELLDWIGPNPPGPIESSHFTVRPPARPWNRAVSQFMLSEPRLKKDAARLVRTGVRSVPTPQTTGCMVFLFPHLDRQLRDVFGLD